MSDLYKHITISPEYTKAVCDAYLSGLSAPEVGLKFNKAPTTIMKTLIKAGVARRNRFYTEDQKQELFDLYNSGLSTRAIAKKLGKCHITIFKALKKLGFKMRDRSHSVRKIALNENYFETIDTEEKAYWLGFLMADGNVELKHNYGRVNLGLATKDEDHIRKFLLAIDSPDTKIHRGRHKGPFGSKTTCYGSQIHVNSLKMASDLNKLGVTPRKSFTATPPIIRDDLEKHFWRGMIDGDGWVSNKELRSNNKMQIGLVGSFNTCTAFASYIDRKFKVQMSVYPMLNIWRVTRNGNGVGPIIVAYLYSNSSIALTRKLDNANKIIETLKTKRDKICIC